MWKRNNSFDMENIDVTFDFTSDTPFIGIVFGTMNLAIQREIRT